MKKVTYQIAIVQNGKKKTKEVSGYLYELGGVKYGIDHRKNYGWIISEFRTGRKVDSTAKLKDIYEVITPEMSEKLKSILERLPETVFINSIE